MKQNNSNKRGDKIANVGASSLNQDFCEPCVTLSSRIARAARAIRQTRATHTVAGF